MIRQIDRERDKQIIDIRQREREIEIYGRFKMVVEYHCEPFQQAATDLSMKLRWGQIYGFAFISPEVQVGYPRENTQN